MKLLFLLAVSINYLNHAESLYKDYSDNRARTMLTLAAASYADNPMTCVNKALPREEHWTIVSHKVQKCDSVADTCGVYIIKSTVMQKFIVAYRGTTGKQQLDEEIKEALRPSIDWYGYGLVNQYFYTALNMTWDAVLPIFSDPTTKSYKVEFVGYSLGGAMATLAALRTISERLRQSSQISLMTFGEPRVGNKEFAYNVDTFIPIVYRVVHKADIVPHSPPCSPYGKYGCNEHDDSAPHHHGTEVWYNNDMHLGASFLMCTRTDEDPNCSNSLGTSYTADDHLQYFGHNVGTYGQNNCVDTPSNHAPVLISCASQVLLAIPLILYVLLL